MCSLLNMTCYKEYPKQKNKNSRQRVPTPPPPPIYFMKNPLHCLTTLQILFNRQTYTGHTRTNRLIYTYQYICNQQLPVLNLMNSILIQKLTLQRSTMSLLFKIYLLAEIIYLLIRFNKTICFLRNAKNTDRNYINEQNTLTNTNTHTHTHTHTHHAKREK